MDLKQEGHKLTIQGSLKDPGLADEIVCNVEVSPGPHECSEDDFREVSPGPILCS